MPDPAQKSREAQHRLALQHLRAHGSWVVLTELVERACSTKLKGITASPELSSQRIDWTRGWVEGARWPIELVEREGWRK